jgi:hypothetical protein
MCAVSCYIGKDVISIVYRQSKSLLEVTVFVKEHERRCSFVYNECVVVSNYAGIQGLQAAAAACS